MSDNDKQLLLLSAIEQLKFQYEPLQSPVIALLISKYYGLLSTANIFKDQQENYSNYSRQWLSCYLNCDRHSAKIQTHLHDFIKFHESALNTL